MPHILSSSARFFKIHGKGLPDDPGTLLKASAGGHVEAKIRVVVLELMTVKLAFGNVAEWNFCVLSASHAPGTAAHEAGHHLFGEFMKGKWQNLHHPWTSKDPDKTPLMREGGAGFKISSIWPCKPGNSSVNITVP